MLVVAWISRVGLGSRVRNVAKVHVVTAELQCMMIVAVLIERLVLRRVVLISEPNQHRKAVRNFVAL